MVLTIAIGAIPMKKTLISTLLILATSTAFATEQNVEPDWESHLQEQEEAYPGCVKVVEDQLTSIEAAQHDAIGRLLLETCMTGREIGEKRTRKMYEIPKEVKPRKMGGFSIKVEPPGDRDDEWDIRY